jgi:hypothetical protein
MILWAEGFDAYGTDFSQMTDGLWAAIGSCSLVSSGPTPRTGTRCLLLDSSAANSRRVLGANKAVVGVAQAVYPTNLPSTPHACPLVEFRDSNNFPQVSVNLDTTGVLSVWRGNDSDPYGTQIGVSTVAMVASAWQHVEVKADFTAETLEVRLNSVTILNVTGQSLVNSAPSSGRATGQVSAAQLQFRNATSGNGDRAIDDLVVWDDTGTLNSDFVGDVKVFTDLPNADTAEVAWTPLSGATRYQMIDEVPANGDTDYDESGATGDRMGVTFPALDAQVAQVLGVIFVAKTRKTDAGICTVQLRAKSGSSEALGAENPLTTAYTYRWDVFEENPATSAPWVPAAAGAAALVLDRIA